MITSANHNCVHPYAIYALCGGDDGLPCGGVCATFFSWESCGESAQTTIAKASSLALSAGHAHPHRNEKARCARSLTS